jgi:hypothetical protein
MGKALPEASGEANAIVAPAQLSLTVGAVQVAMDVQAAPAFTLMLLGQAAITGAVTSTTVTVKEQVELLPAASMAV